MSDEQQQLADPVVFVPDAAAGVSRPGEADAHVDHPEPDGPAGEAAAGKRETGGREGPDPTRFGDWEIKGRCIDF